MTTTEWEKLKQDASETIKEIDTSKLTKTTYTLLGASLAILDHQPEKEGNMPAIQKEPTQAITAHSAGKSLQEIVDDELSDAEMYYSMGEREIAMDELRHADIFLSKLKAQAITGADTAFINEMTMRRNQIAMKL